MFDMPILSWSRSLGYFFKRESKNYCLVFFVLKHYIDTIDINKCFSRVKHLIRVAKFVITYSIHCKYNECITFIKKILVPNPLYL